MKFLRRIHNLLGLLMMRIFFHSKIDSAHVSYKSICGRNIQIQAGSRVDSQSQIGGNTYIGLNSYVTRSKIGRYVSIANNVSIGQGEHDLHRISTSSIFYQNPWEALTGKACEIEGDVWIGVDAVILRGVKIGFGAVVGANSVVTSDVPSFAIVVGAPARVIKFRFSPDKIQSIIDSEWWQSEPKEAAIIQSHLENIFP